MNLTPDQKIQTDERLLVSFFLQCVSKNNDIFSFSLTISQCWIQAFSLAFNVKLRHGFRQLLPRDDLDVHQAFQLSP